MSILEKLASAQNQKSEAPNQELARQLAASEDRESLNELVENLSSKNAAIHSNCIKTLYEIGYLKPELIAPYAADFLKLLSGKNNRLVWGGMMALAVIAPLTADELFPHTADIQKAMEKGSVITVDNGVAALAGIASRNPAFNLAIFPFLLHHLQTCRPKEVPQHAEKTLIAVNADNKVEFIQLIEKRLQDASPSETVRLKRIIKKAAAI
jgi:hypothetical protein